MRLQITWQVNFSQPPSYIVHPHLSSHSEVLVVLVMQSWASRLKTWVSAWCTCRPAKAKLRLERLMTHPNVHHKQRCRVCRVWQWRSHRRCQTLPVLQIGIGDLHMVLAVSARAVVLVVPGVLVVPACPVAVLVVPLVSSMSMSMSMSLSFRSFRSFGSFGSSTNPEWTWTQSSWWLWIWLRSMGYLEI